MEREFLKVNSIVQSEKRAYRILEQVGCGGTSLVYRGRVLEDNEEKENVILKEFFPGQTNALIRRWDGRIQAEEKAAEKFVERMKAEKSSYEFAKSLLYMSGKAHRDANHPHSWNYIDAFEANGTFYQVCQDVEGTTLNKVLDSGIASFHNMQDYIRLLLLLIPAVRPVHEKNYVHCDLKPENFFVVSTNPPTCRCIDFGSAVPKGSSILISCSYDYSVPEVSFSEDKKSFSPKLMEAVDYSFDTYSLLAIIYEKLTGDSVRNIDWSQELFSRMDDEIFHVSEEALCALNRIFRNGLSRNSFERYPDLDSLEKELQELMKLLDKRVFLRSLTYRDFYPLPPVSEENEMKFRKALQENTTFIYMDACMRTGWNAADNLEICFEFVSYCRKQSRKTGEEFCLVPVAFQECLEKTLMSLPFGNQNTERDVTEADFLKCLEGINDTYYILILGYRYQAQDEGLLSKLLHLKGRFIFIGLENQRKVIESRRGTTISVACSVTDNAMQYPYGFYPVKIEDILRECDSFGINKGALKLVLKVGSIEKEMLPKTACFIGDRYYFYSSAALVGSGADREVQIRRILDAVLNSAGTAEYYYGNNYEALTAEDFKLCVFLLEQLSCNEKRISLLSRLFCLADEKKYHRYLKEHYIKTLDKYAEGTSAQLPQLVNTVRELAILMGKAGSAGNAAYVLKNYKNILYNVTEPLEKRVHLDLNNQRYECVIETCQGLIELFSYGKMYEAQMVTYYDIEGKAYYCTGRYEEALEAFDREILLDQSCASAWFSKGFIYSACYVDKDEEALKAFDQAIALNEAWAEPWENKGLVYLWLGRYEEALKAYDRSIILDKTSYRAWSGKGDVYYKLGRYGEALKAYDRSIMLDETHSRAWSGKGDVYYKLGRYEEALGAYEHALILDKDNMGYRNRYLKVQNKLSELRKNADK